MHGLVFRCLETFVRVTAGDAAWAEIARSAQPGLPGFEPMLSYDAALAEPLLAGAQARLNRSRTGLLEDIGTFLVTNPRLEAVRRLLRFGGADYCDFLLSLDDLPGRVHLALPELDMPGLTLVHVGPDRFDLHIDDPRDLFAPVLVGLLRAMADDYGVLACVELQDTTRGAARIVITVAEDGFAAGRVFDLGAGLRDRRVAR